MTSEQEKHSPLPWEASGESVSDKGDWTPAEVFSVADQDNPKIVCTLAARKEMNANASLIAEAVNSHAVLVEALRAALLYLDWAFRAVVSCDVPQEFLEKEVAAKVETMRAGRRLLESLEKERGRR